MPTQFIATAAAAFLFTVHFADSAAAQYHHEYWFHHGGIQGHAHDYHHGFEYHAGHYQGYGGHAHYRDNDYLGHGGLDTYCPATSVCPLQYQLQSEIGSPYLEGRSFQNVPFNNAPAYDERNFVQPDDHAGHDHASHSYDAHSHGPVSPDGAVAPSDGGYLAPPSLPSASTGNFPSQQDHLRDQYPRDDSRPIASPPQSTFDPRTVAPPSRSNQSQFDTPLSSTSQRDLSVQPSDGSFRIDTPPPASF
ncbi:hypothetical protein NHH03_16445 [Stieleria sp. TO1_6]|uniref:hypothetical protein n=1 Tax=Stieleria tagensis TaxID=2956795 RepID=UPI00209AB343|nr:hypothetical protein [Stieleria tagensis]MCO8123341.1 hypothetical protein [Stieleria tagensis]